MGAYVSEVVHDVVPFALVPQRSAVEGDNVDVLLAALLVEL